MKLKQSIFSILLFSCSFTVIAEPTLWKIQSDKAEIYLFGSIHVGKQEMYPLPTKINNAFNNSQHLVREIDLLNPSMIAAVVVMYLNATLPNKQTLKDVMSTQNLLKLQQVLKTLKIPYASLANLKPWLIGMNLQMLMLSSKDFKPELGVDIHFAQRALITHKDVIELESAAEQFSYFEKLNMQQQIAFMLGSLEQIESGQQTLKKIIDYWQKGDQKAFTKLIMDDFKVSEEETFFYEIFLKNRNIKMADKIAAFLDQGGSYFVVVGAAHYVGNDSIIHYLNKKGLKVIKMN